MNPQIWPAPSDFVKSRFHCKSVSKISIKDLKRSKPMLGFQKCIQDHFTVIRKSVYLKLSLFFVTFEAFEIYLYPEK